MAKSIRCRDVGMNCDFTAKAETTEELLQAAAAHASEAHGLDSIPAELMPMVQAAIRDEKHEPGSGDKNDHRVIPAGGA